MDKEITEQLKSLSKTINRILKLFKEYERLTDNPSLNAYMLDKKLGVIEKSASGLPDFILKDSLINLLDKAKSELEKAKEDFRFQFGKQLKELLEKEGMKMRGQYPLLRIGFYTLKLNFEFGEAALFFGPEIEKIRSKITLQPEIIYETIKNYDKELTAMKLGFEQIFNGFIEAYRRCIILANKSFGEKIFINEVFREFIILKQPKQFFVDYTKEKFHEYSRIKLSYWLYQLKKANFTQRGMKLHVATFDATLDKLRAIWIPENEDGEGTYYSYISFDSASR